MSAEVLEEQYTFDTNQLIEPIRKAATVRQIATVKTTLQVEDLEVDIYDVNDDFHIRMSTEVTERSRNAQYINKNTYKTGILQAEVEYGIDALRRINRGPMSMDERVMAVGAEVARYEDALALAVTTTGVRDGQAKPFLQNGTSTAFDLSDYAAGKTSIATYIGAVATTFGNLKPYALKFAFNDKFFQTALGLSNSTTDDALLEYIDAQLKMYGGPGSGIIQASRLGCAVTVSSDELVITNEADEACALFVDSPMNYEIYESRLEVREENSTRDGYAGTIVQRWFPWVHRAGSILYDIDATP